MAQYTPTASANVSGGTVAPKGPPGVGKAKAPSMPRYLNKASGKMETSKQMGAYRAPSRAAAAAQALGAPKGNVHPKGPAPQHTPTKASPSHAEKNFTEMNPAQLHSLAVRTTQANTQAELVPFRRSGQEINSQEQGTLNRIAGMGRGEQTVFGNLQQNAEASAKTANNEAADAALRASKAVETTGQSQAQANAGYVGPALAAQQQAFQANTQQIGQAGQQATALQGQGEANYLQNVRAAAAQRITEQQGGARTQFAGQRTALQGKEQQMLGRQAGAATKLQTELAQKQFTNRAAEQGLGIKLSDLAVNQAKQKTNEVNTTLKAKSISATEKNNAETRKLEERGQNVTVRGQNISAETQREQTRTAAKLKAEELAYKKQGLAEKERYDSAKITEMGAKIKEELARAKSPLTPSESNKLSSELAGAYRTVVSMAQSGNAKLIREALPRGSYQIPNAKNPKEGKPENVKTPAKVSSGPIIQAAIELYYKHTVSKSTRAELGRMGMNIGYDQEIFQTVNG